MPQLHEIQIRDPYVLPVPGEGKYYLFGSTDANIWSGPGTGFDCYTSNDLESWEGPLPAFRPSNGFWGTTEFWAPEVHEHDGRYFMFATFHGEGTFRGTQILAADKPEGPYEPWSEGPVTPSNWQCLDGTLHIDGEGSAWVVFCQEWTQIHDGAIYARKLTPDLRSAAGRPIFLFNASEAPWARQLKRNEPLKFPVFVTDGPFLHRTRAGTLLMLWSSIGTNGYAMGIARSESGTVLGPWTQDEDPIWGHDGGHGMIFRSFDGHLYLALHQPNHTPDERAVLRPLAVNGDGLSLEAAS
ncbi:glycoside hydrolase family 43 protein [Arthrobacter sp. 260]|uniref:glycoside hydrolase family 43 protein n=1 Tax=Arthrobacter sp. 260 TaxID=2735314 RepID=UPI001491EA0B|nr:glycoside hydrolase family 43 protein [Arthrobacter sp. 260]NOJ58796.1 family 43 glycosylhydrolase [Arthrobacter sp. 260]